MIKPYLEIAHFKDNVKFILNGGEFYLSDGWNADNVIFHGVNEEGENLMYTTDGYFHINKEMEEFLDEASLLLEAFNYIK